jgi:glycerate kinase
MRLLIAPDYFKGSLSAGQAAAAIGEGCSSVRPADEIELIPLGDGGEGTLEVPAAAVAGSSHQSIQSVTGPDGRSVRGEWLRLPGNVALVELAQTSGLLLISELDPLGAATRGVWRSS